jgi:hypothetical protein
LTIFVAFSIENKHTWVISKVLHTVRFLFKNEFILQNTFTGLQLFSIVLYHSDPTSGQVLYSCQDALDADASDHSGHLIRHPLNASEAFPTEWFFSVLGTSQSLVGSCQDCTAGGKALAIHIFTRFPILHLRHGAARYRA